MTVYWVLLLIAAAGIPICGFTDKKSDKRCTAYCVMACVVLTVVSSIRFSVGYDYNLYAGFYYDLNFMDMADISVANREQGFLMLLKLLNTITEYYGPAFVLISLLIYPPLAVYIRKNSPCLWLSFAAFLAFGLFFNSMNFMRQFIAAVICAFAFCYAEKGSFPRFALTVILACAFHRSALLVLPCWCFVFVGWNYLTLAAASAGTLFIYLFSENILRLATQYVYTDYDISRSKDLLSGLSPFYTVMFGVLFAAAFLLRNRIKCGERKKNILIWCSFASFFFELIGTKYAVISRFGLLFFIPAVTVLLPEMFISVSESVKSKRAAAVVIGVFMCLNYSALLYNNYNGVVPYKTVFSHEGRAAYGK